MHASTSLTLLHYSHTVVLVRLPCSLWALPRAIEHILASRTCPELRLLPVLASLPPANAVVIFGQNGLQSGVLFCANEQAIVPKQTKNKETQLTFASGAPKDGADAIEHAFGIHWRKGGSHGSLHATLVLSGVKMVESEPLSFV